MANSNSVKGRIWNSKDYAASFDPITYICKNADGEVIYVGRARNGKKRFAVHKVDYWGSTWWPEVEKIIVRRHLKAHPDQNPLANSLVLEALLIRKYQPKYNKQGVTR